MSLTDLDTRPAYRNCLFFWCLWMP